ncbi:hypothetical protein [Microbispora triticiradicis]|uniref:hypothetical protein n=1 Tax=Microbispora triticiradicis TaxID=2200763 RepID=UPI001AD7CE62|nr:hypothetical protein [Microbispora triticiradicis]
MQFRQVVGPNPLHPLLQARSGEVNHHLGEGTDVLAKGGQGRAVRGQGLQVLVFVGVKIVGVAEEPAGGLADEVGGDGGGRAMVVLDLQGWTYSRTDLRVPPKPMAVISW